MIRRIAQIRVEGDDLSLAVPVSWGAGARAKVSVAFGSVSADAQLRVMASSSPAIVVGEPLARELHLTPGMRLQLSYDSSHLRVSLGPILGVFTVKHPLFGGQRPGPYGSRQALYRPLIELAERNGLVVYLFSPGDVDWSSRTVMGYSLQRGKWGFARYPLPDVVYDRIPSRRDESRPEVIRAKERLQKECHYFNPSYLNKWDVHSLLAKRAESKTFLPETRLLRTVGDLLHFLGRYDEVYLKPTMSSVGRGIMKITKTAQGYLLHHRRGQTIARSSYSGVTELFTAVSLLRRRRTYLVQQGIDLATFQGHHFDIRALAQKDGAGNWTVTGMAARVAALGAIVTHVPNGGTRQPLKRVIPADRFLSVKQQLQGAGRLIPKVLEEEMGQTFGELSLDLAVDHSGKVWLIEANAKPFRFDEPAIRGVARQRLLDYACYLHGSR